MIQDSKEDLYPKLQEQGVNRKKSKQTRSPNKDTPEYRWRGDSEREVNLFNSR